MDEVRTQLTIRERALLTDLWQNKDILKSLQSMLSHKQLQTAQSGIMLSPDFSQVMRSRGNIEACQWIFKFLKYNFNESEKKRKQETLA